MSPDHPAMNAAAMDDTFGTSGRVRGRLRYEDAADAFAGAALGEEGNDYGKQEGIFTSPSILLDSFPISHPVEYTDDEDDEDFVETAAQLSSVDGRFDEDDAHEDEDDEDDEDFVETAAQLSSVDGRFAEEEDCKQEGNGKHKWISTSPAVPTINSHPIADGDSDEEDSISHAAAIAATAPAATVVPPAPSAAAAVPATHAAASIVGNAVPNHEFKTTTSARGVPILVARDRPGNRLLYDVIIVFVAVGIPPTDDTFGTSGRVRGRFRYEEPLQQ